MNKELTAALVKDFPSFFRDIYGNPRETCMAWGISCGDGWEPLIRGACAAITPLVGDDFVFMQIKEKFGGLRMYYYGATHAAQDVLSVVEDESYKVCEQCGSRDGVTSEGGWVLTLCKACREVGR